MCLPLERTQSRVDLDEADHHVFLLFGFSSTATRYHPRRLLLRLRRQHLTEGSSETSPQSCPRVNHAGPTGPGGSRICLPSPPLLFLSFYSRALSLTFLDILSLSQFLPIQWRASLKLVHNAAEAQEDIDHDLHNEFTLDDVTLKNAIPYVRELTNAVLFVLSVSAPSPLSSLTLSRLFLRIDIPLFMSSHKQSMVEAVSMECNRTYRKWCLRHPEFAEKGRVVSRFVSLRRLLLLSSSPPLVDSLLTSFF